MRRGVGGGVGVAEQAEFRPFFPVSSEDDSVYNGMGDEAAIPSSFGTEYKLRHSLCIHAFHHIDDKDSDVHVLDW